MLGWGTRRQLILMLLVLTGLSLLLNAIFPYPFKQPSTHFETDGQRQDHGDAPTRTKVSRKAPDSGILLPKNRSILTRLKNYRFQSPSNSPILEYLARKVDYEQPSATTTDYPTFLSTPLGNSTTYQETYCNLEGGEWCPSGRDAWQQNAPFLMILGSKKAGTTSLFQFLTSRHPQIVSGKEKELLFFNQRNFAADIYLDSKEEGGRVRVQTIRRAYHQQLFPRVRAMQRIGAISLDASPQYLFDWPIAARPILCSSPWVKLLVIVRHPTDRIWSHYNFARHVLRKRNISFNFTFEGWVQHDLDALSRAGLIDARSNQKGSSNAGTDRSTAGLSDEELAAAWSKYTATNIEGPVGRGLYASHLYQWFQELRRLGRDPREAMKIVRLEDMKGDDQVAAQVFEEIVEWLGLPPARAAQPEGKHTNSTNSTKEISFNHGMKTVYEKGSERPILAESTKELLDAFYAPYNDILARLLGDKRWEYRRKTSRGDEPVVVWPPNEPSDRWDGVVGALFRTPSNASMSAIPCGERYKGSTLEFDSSFAKMSNAIGKKLDNSVYKRVRNILNQEDEPGNRGIRTDRWGIVENSTCVVQRARSATQNAKHLNPLAVIIGAQRGGLTPLARFLKSHPEIASLNTQPFFLSHVMDQKLSAGGIDQQYWQGQYFDELKKNMVAGPAGVGLENQDVSNSTLYFVDVSSNYLLFSDRVPQRLLCLQPNAKVVILLRNPVDRALSQYKMHIAMNETIPPLLKWIRGDLEVLLTLGVLKKDKTGSPTRFLGYTGSQDEKDGWKAYTKLAAGGAVSPIGRGLYSLQLLQWKEAFEAHNKTLDFLVLASESVARDPKAAYHRICNYLNISRLDITAVNSTTSKNQDSIIWDRARHMLEQVFEPYNRQLADLLGKNWKNIWNSNGMTEVVQDHHPLYTFGIPQSDESPILAYLRNALTANANSASHIHDTNDATTSLRYQLEHCDLEGGEWCPSGNDSWQRRAPHFMIIGAKKAGTTSFFFFMNQHPQIVPGVGKELMFFNQRRFSNEKYVDGATGKIKVQTVRTDLTKLFPSLLKQVMGNSSHSTTSTKKFSYDATPQYLYNWATAPKQILCSCPWIKLLVVVRNPTDRLWSHFNYINELLLKTRNQTMGVSFEQWIEQDMQHLLQHGLIEGSNRTHIGTNISHKLLNMPYGGKSRTLTELEMTQAWSNYTMRSPEGPVGRGLYALSLHQWFVELRRMGRNPRDTLKIVRLEDLKRNETVAAQIFNEITEWLGLSSSSSSATQPKGFSHGMKTDYARLGAPTLLESTRKMLDEFYAPYNHMLSLLLGDDGWEYNRSQEPLINNTGGGTNTPLSSDSLAAGHEDDRVVVWPTWRSGRYENVSDLNLLSSSSASTPTQEERKRFFPSSQLQMTAICEEKSDDITNS